MNGPLLIVGDLCPDIIVAGVLAPDRRLRFGQAEDLVGSTTLTLGSSAGITASAAVAAGCRVRLCAVVGDDDLGRSCLGWLAARGVDVADVRVDQHRSTGSSVILVRRDDPTDRQILTHLGAMARLRAADVTDTMIRTAAHLHVSSFFLHQDAREDLHQPMARARRGGITVSLDTNDDPERRWTSGVHAAIGQADILFCNDTEAVGLAFPATSDLATDDLAEGRGAVDQAIARLLDLMPTGSDPRFPAVVHKRGADGAVVHTHAGTVQVGVPTVRVVDTVGAGDTLAGTALAALLDGADWPVAIRLAVAAGSLSTAGVGGVDAQPPFRDTRRVADNLSVLDQRQAQELTP